MIPKSDNTIQTNVDVAIIGAGFAGVGAGIRLKQEGNTSFIIFEKANEVGGTWRDNTYPGCGCDIPSMLYSYSFEPNPNWSRMFSPQAEILEYVKHCVEKHKLEQHIQFNTEIADARFDEQQGIWRIIDKTGREVTAKVVISAAGPFNAPFIPNLKGKDDFEGKVFHSMNWDHDYDLSDKTVAVIGTGASAIQFVPAIIDKVKNLFLYQRTPPYIAPRNDKENGEKAKETFKKYPWYQRFWREVIYWALENRGRSNYSNNKMRAKRKKVALDYLKESIPDPELREKLTPDYEIGCKRILISDNYYAAMKHPKLELITEGIEEIKKQGLISKDGKLRKVDAIIYGTGFYTTEFPKIFNIIGRDNKNLFSEWNANGPEAYYGMAVSGFPQLLFMVGPNTGLGHNSIIHMMESQLNYILDYLKMVKKAPATTFFDLKPAVQQQFNEDVQQKLSTMVWSEGGCKSYYLKDGDGKNTSIWPGSTYTFRKKTRKVNPSDYIAITPNASLKTAQLASPMTAG